MRVIKDAEARRNEILDAAEAHFARKGFDGTSTSDILEQVGIARGTLYYHFKSKGEIMDALIERKSSRILSAAREIAEDRSIPVLERMMRALEAMNMRGGDGQEMLEQMHRPQNALLHAKIQSAMIAGVPPILASVVCEGIAQGIFSTPFPYESVEMLVVYANAIFDEETVPLTEEALSARMRAFAHNAGRLLGIREDQMKAFAHMLGMGEGGDADEEK